ncbi:MAG: tetraacyldisaccharide 4'-kinase [Porphyromonadaceae bacterium CG2_30_38_12]|nr:MAG: tetraacyldisaccharide 4'-kinase [Porphyromonadaceae bacterium CG2_30_38_12]
MKNQFKLILLYPFSVLYGWITATRNLLYNKGFLQTTSFQVPIICVGNLAVGGTGKTPHIELLIAMLQENYKVAVLSRGYQRKTKGYLIATDGANSNTIGDEPFQIFKKYNKVTVAVDEKRVHGVQQLLRLNPPIDIILLDDGFQHRAIQAGLNIVLTDYAHLYIHDQMLPAGSLREYPSGAQRADIILITKCPTQLTEIDTEVIEKKIKLLPHQQLFFSCIQYQPLQALFPVQSDTQIIDDFAQKQLLLVTGIVSHEPIVAELTCRGACVEVFAFADHHRFSAYDYRLIEQKLLHLQAEQKKLPQAHEEKPILVITEKDAARIVSSADFPASLRSVTYYLPIKISVLQNKQALLKAKITNYVTENKRNS